MKNCIKNEGNKIPSIQSTEYLLCVNPPPYEELWKKITGIKRDFTSKFDCKIASSTKPHVTLLHFFQHEAKEHRIIKRFEQIAKTQSHITVELKIFGSFQSHTIYINVISKAPLLKLSKNLKEVRTLLNKPIFLTEPHLTIARRLLPQQFEKASLEYSKRNFIGHFVADKMILLKRQSGNMYYQHVQDFEFLGIPDQGLTKISLFN
jgi:2'-5' RNA ligase